jgi:hypothetical protein
MTHKLISIGFSILAMCALGQQTSAPQDVRTRQLSNSIWLSRRPPGTKTVTTISSVAGDVACLGITLWRLRPSQATDDFDVRERINDSSQQWTAVRVAVGTPLAEGERLRISVETTRSGYLYVTDDKSVLFPPAGSDNHLVPGAMRQIPVTSFFTLTRDRADQVSEPLTFWILPQPVEDLLHNEKITGGRERWQMPAQGLEDRGEIGKAITRAEMQAGRDRSKVLTQDDALPQTMYRCRAKTGDPLILDVALPIQKDARVISRGVDVSRPVPPSQPAPLPTPTLAKRVTAGDFLSSSQTEKEGYGLYSYILFGARPESLSSDRWRRYYEAIVAYLDIPTVGDVSRSVRPASTNLTLLPLALPENELPAGGSSAASEFRFDAQRLAAHQALHKVSGKQWYHDSSNGAAACMLVGNYDYARAQGLLALLRDSHMEGPYIISVAEPLSRTRALPAQYLYQDLSSVPPELIRLWVKEFMAQAQENEFWKTRSKDQFVLRLRTAIGVMSQQIPDLGKSITWTFISVSPQR